MLANQRNRPVRRRDNRNNNIQARDRARQNRNARRGQRIGRQGNIQGFGGGRRANPDRIQVRPGLILRAWKSIFMFKFMIIFGGLFFWLGKIWIYNRAVSFFSLIFQIIINFAVSSTIFLSLGALLKKSKREMRKLKHLFKKKSTSEENKSRNGEINVKGPSGEMIPISIKALKGIIDIKYSALITYIGFPMVLCLILVFLNRVLPIWNSTRCFFYQLNVVIFFQILSHISREDESAFFIPATHRASYITLLMHTSQAVPFWILTEIVRHTFGIFSKLFVGI